MLDDHTPARRRVGDRQDYPDIETIVVDDGSRNVADVIPVHDEFCSGRFQIVRQPDNGESELPGGRLRSGAWRPRRDYRLRHGLEPNAIRTIVRRFSDPRVGAVTGNVEVINDRHHLLTRLISQRYWMAFNQERAAQSYFGVVMCASGPFSAYRRSIIDAVKHRYVTQSFPRRNLHLRRRPPSDQPRARGRSPRRLRGGRRGAHARPRDDHNLPAPAGPLEQELLLAELADILAIEMFVFDSGADARAATATGQIKGDSIGEATDQAALDTPSTAGQ